MWVDVTIVRNVQNIRRFYILITYKRSSDWGVRCERLTHTADEALTHFKYKYSSVKKKSNSGKAIKVSGSPCLGQGTWKVELTPSFYFISTDIIRDPYLIRSCRVGRPKRPRTSNFFTLQSSALTNRLRATSEKTRDQGR